MERGRITLHPNCLKFLCFETINSAVVAPTSGQGGAIEYRSLDGLATSYYDASITKPPAGICRSTRSNIVTINVQASSLAEQLSLIGDAGAALLEEALHSRQNSSVVSTDHSSASVTTFIQAHALVWFSISLAVPVDIGKKLMDGHLSKTHERLAEGGSSSSFEEFKARVGSSWMTLVMAQKSSGTPMFGICNAVLEGCTGRQDRDIVGSMEILPAITEIMSATRAAVLAEYPTYDTEPDPSEEPAPAPVVPEHAAERYPLETESIAALGVEEARHHLQAMAAYPNARTLVEYRRREGIRLALKGRIGADLPARAVENSLAQPTGVPTTPTAPEIEDDAGVPRGNPVAVASLVLGLLSIVSWFLVIIPILAMVTGSAGLTKAKERGGKGKVMAGVGVGLGVLFAIVHVVLRIATAASAG